MYIQVPYFVQHKGTHDLHVLRDVYSYECWKEVVLNAMGVCIHWTGLLDWITGLTFHLFLHMLNYHNGKQKFLF